MLKALIKPSIIPMVQYIVRPYLKELQTKCEGQKWCTFSNILNGVFVRNEIFWNGRVKDHSFSDGHLTHVGWTIIVKSVKYYIGHRKIKMTFWRQVQFNNLFKKTSNSEVALFVIVHNDLIFVKCSNIFDRLFDRILEWVSNWLIPFEMEFSKFELVFENLVQVSFSSKF